MSKFSELKAKKILLPVISGSNPIDLTAEATSSMFGLTLSILLSEPSIGGIVIIALHHAPTILDDTVEVIARAVPEYKKPVVVCDMGETEMAETMRTMFEKRGIPSYSMPERTARALWALTCYGKYLREQEVRVEETQK
jgi:acetyltransferase